MLAFPPEEHAKLRFVRHLSVEKKIVIKQRTDTNTTVCF